MTTRWDDIPLESNYSDASWDSWEENEQYRTPKSCIPKVGMSRKRTSCVAKLDIMDDLDDLVIGLQQRLKLNPRASRRLEVADKILRGGEFAGILMKSLPEVYVRKLAVLSREWKVDAYKILRERKGNNAIAILWKAEQQFGENQKACTFDLGTFIDPSYLAGAQKEGNGELALLKQVDFALAFGNLDMGQDNDSSSSTYPTCPTMFVTSDSVVTTTPDCVRLLDSFSENETQRRMVSSVLFPACMHLNFELFEVPSSVSAFGPKANCEVVGDVSTEKKPKVIILFQYLDLVESEGEGIQDVLTSLRTIAAAANSEVPVIPGVYKSLESSNKGVVDTDSVACGLVINGDELCQVEVITMDLNDFEKTFGASSLDVVVDFFLTNDLSTKLVLVFYDDQLSKQDCEDGTKFTSFLKCFNLKLPNVPLMGIGSVCSVIPRFYNPAKGLVSRLPNSNDCYLDSANAVMKVVLVLISYEADGKI